MGLHIVYHMDMKVAVITPYFKEDDDVLSRCRESVSNQTYHSVTHYFVSDGFPNPLIDTWDDCIHLKVPNHNDFGDTPRIIGAMSANTAGYDFIMFLDADNYIDENHVTMMVNAAVENQANLVTASRNIILDDEVVGKCPEVDGLNFCDTNCFFFHKSAIMLLAHMGFKRKEFAIIGDRVLWDAVKNSNCVRVHITEPTVYYQSSFAFHYQYFGKEIPDDSKIIMKIGEGAADYRMMTHKEYKTICLI